MFFKKITERLEDIRIELNQVVRLELKRVTEELSSLKKKMTELQSLEERARRAAEKTDGLLLSQAIRYIFKADTGEIAHKSSSMNFERNVTYTYGILEACKSSCGIVIATFGGEVFYNKDAEILFNLLENKVKEG